MTVTIRPATEGDQPTIRRLINEARINRFGLNFWPNFVLAEEDGQVVGLGQVKAHTDGSRELASIAVVPGRQREGIGTAIIKALLAREADTVLHLTCRRELEGYYKRFGFARVEPAAYSPYFRRTVAMVNVIGRFVGLHIIVMRREAVG